MMFETGTLETTHTHVHVHTHRHVHRLFFKNYFYYSELDKSADQLLRGSGS